MSTSLENGFKVYTDWDGTQVHGPPPLRTALALYQRRFQLPDLQAERVPYQRRLGLLGVSLCGLNLLQHGVRPPDFIGRKALVEFKRIGADHKVPVEIDVLTGREPYLHGLTKAQIRLYGYDGLVDDVHMNDEKSASGYKIGTIAEDMERGEYDSYVLLDDDIKPGKGAARIGALSYVKRNFSNREWLLHRGGIEEEENLILVPDFVTAAVDFGQRVDAIRRSATVYSYDEAQQSVYTPVGRT